jgi:chorismate synthase
MIALLNKHFTSPRNEHDQVHILSGFFGPDSIAAEKMIALVEEVKKEGDSIGGVIKCVIRNVIPGLGEPVFDKLSANCRSYGRLSHYGSLLKYLAVNGKV